MLTGERPARAKPPVLELPKAWTKRTNEYVAEAQLVEGRRDYPFAAYRHARGDDLL